MSPEILKRRYKIRHQGYRGRQITLPPGALASVTTGSPVTLLHSDKWVLLVPVETPVDEQVIQEAIKLK